MSVLNQQMICDKSKRREKVREANKNGGTWNGIDFVEFTADTSAVSIDSASVHLLCPIDAPGVLDGRLSITDERGNVAAVVDCVDYESTSSVRIHFSPLSAGTYRLHLNAAGIDPRHSSAEFRFSTPVVDVDPRPRDECPPAPAKEPEVNYLARDYQSFRQVILDRLALIMPDWRERHAADLGMTLVEMLAYMGDHLSYYQDAVATEAYLGTARSRVSVRRHARLVDYTLHEGCNARTFLRIEVNGDTAFEPRNVYFITRPQNPELKDKTVLAHHELEFERPGSYLGFEAVHVPMPACAVEEWHGMNWVGFLAVLTQPKSWLPKMLHKLMTNMDERRALMDQIAELLKTDIDEIPSLLLNQFIGELNAVLSQHPLWEAAPGKTESIIVATVKSAYSGNQGLLPRLNRLLLQLAWPQHFAFCQSTDGTTVDDPEPLVNLMFPSASPKRVRLHEAHNAISFYTWDQNDCCLPKGATSATLVDHSTRPYDELVTGCSPTVEQATWKRHLRLRPGDLLLLQEVKGAKTGNKADADPARRQVVRLTRVQYKVDPIHQDDLRNGRPICNVEWSHEDKLRFPLCISSTTSAPDCRQIDDVSLAFGNIILVDHGITTDKPQQIGIVPRKSGNCGCGCTKLGCGCSNGSSQQKTPLKFYLNDSVDLTFAAPVASCQTASTLRNQKPHKALPALDVTGMPVDPLAPVIHEDQPRSGILQLEDLNSKEQLLARLPQMSEEARWILLDLLPSDQDDFVTKVIENPGQRVSDPDNKAGQLLESVRQLLDWQPRQHLMDSRSDDRHFALEIDNDRRTSLRFGNGREGKRPAAETAFYSSYRVGNGPVGNIGQDKLDVVVFRDTPVTGIRSITNPLPAMGGTEPETSQHARMHAPQAFRTLQRAILVDDYRELVMRDFARKVQQARATMAQVGTRSVISVVVDPFVEVRDVNRLHNEIETRLRRYARLGHEVDVRSPNYVALHIEVKVQVHSGYLKGEIQRELLSVFSTGMLPYGTRGFFHPDNLTFGSSIYLSRIVATAKKIHGVSNVEVTQLRRETEDPMERTAQQHLDDGVLKLQEFEIPLITNDPGQPNSGAFVVTMEAGR